MTNHTLSTEDEGGFKFDKYVSKQTQYHLNVTVVSILLFLFGISTFIYRIVQTTWNLPNLTLTYFILGFISDSTAMVIGFVGITLNTLWKLPKAKYPFLIMVKLLD